MDEQSIFLAALEKKTSAERKAFLDGACQSDPEIRKRIETLLRQHDPADGFLEQPAFGGDQTMDVSRDAMEAGLSQAFGADAAVLIGDGGHSVLKSLSKKLPNVPRVLLREEAGDGALEKPDSKEVPPRSTEDRYQLHGEIARGGMGAILKGRDTDLGRDLAIKVLLETHKEKPEVIQRFVEEAQIGGQLQHPGIAPVYELGQFADQRPFFSMKLVKGQTLSKLLADRDNPAEDRGRLIGIFEQVCQTMAYAHSRGVIHRDLKPANIMVGAFGEVQLMDWGLAKVLQAGGIEDEKQAHGKHNDISIIQTMRSVGSDTPGMFGTHGSHTQMGSVMGTPAYMPPEQALGEIDQLDERADVFGLGAILCEILTGKPPYVADDGTQVFRMASRGKLNECLARLDACGADAELIAVAKHCLELEPVDRPRDAAALADQVTKYLESVESKLRKSEVERAEQVARADAEAAQANAERQRRRTSLALAASVLLLFGLGSGGWLYLERQEANRQTAEAAAQREHAKEMDRQRQLAQVAQRVAEEERGVAFEAQQVAEAARRVAEAAEKRGRQLLYAANMQLASSGNNNIEGDSHGLLAAWIPPEPPTEEKPDLREFAWRRQWTRLYEGGIHSVLNARAATISPDGNLITADSEGIREWFPTSELRSWRWKGDATEAVFSPHGRWAVIPNEAALQLLDVTSGKTFHTFETGPFVTSSDGRFIAISRSVGDIEVFEVDGMDVEPRGKISRQTFELPLSAARFCLAPDGRSFAWRKGYDLMAGIFASRERPVVWQNASGVTTCAWSPDGQIVATGDDAGQILLRRASQPEEHEIIGTYGRGITNLCFSPDSTQLAAGRGNGTTELWDISITDKGVSGEVNKIIGGNALVTSLVFSADGTKLATLDSRRTATLWELSNPNGRHEFKRSVYDHIGDIGVVWETVGGELRVHELMPDGPAAKSGRISIGDRAVRITDGSGDRTLDIPTGVSAGPRGSRIQIEIEKRETSGRHVVELACSLPVQFYGYDELAISPSGKLVTVANSIVGATCWTTDGRFVRFYPAKGSSVRYSSDGRFLALADRNEVVLWDLKNDQLHKRLPFQCTLLAFSPDARHLAFATSSSELHVWELASWTQVARLPCGKRTYQGAFTPQGDHLIVVDRNRNAVTVWNAQTWKVERGFEAGRSNSMAVSPNGRVVAIGGRHVVELWEIRTGEFIKHIASPTNPHTLAFSPDGRTLASGTVFWDGVTGNPLRYYREHDTIMRGAEFSLDGEILATLSTDGVLYVQKAKSFAEIERHPLTLRSMYDLASLRAKQGRFDEAEATLRYTLQRQLTSLPQAHSDISDTRSLLRSVLVAQDELPVVASSPRWQSTALGQSVHFEVKTTRDGAWSYQWFHNGIAIAGATERSLSIRDVKTVDFGKYHVEIEAEEHRSTVPATRSETAFLFDERAPIGSGALLREVFQNVPGDSVEQLIESEQYQSGQPDIVEAIDSWEAPSDFDENYGQRITGFLLPPQTGDYVFYLVADDASELYISSDESPDNCKLVASVRSWTPPRGWQSGVAARSKPIHLEAGKRYAVKTLMKEDYIGDHLAVTWQMPGDPPPQNGDPPIPGKFLEFSGHRATAK